MLNRGYALIKQMRLTTSRYGIQLRERVVSIEWLYVTSRTLRNHFRRTKRPASIRTRRVVYVGSMLQSTYSFRLVLAESTGLVVLQWFNSVALTIAQLELLRRPGRQEYRFIDSVTRS